MKRNLLFVLLCAFCLFGSDAFAQPATHVVISEVYGGGGNGGATLKNDFVELYNPTSLAVDLTGWSIQYASSTGSSWQVTNLNGSIPAKGYYLVQEAQGAGGTVDLPVPNATGAILMAAGAGKVALVSVTTALTGSCPTTNVIDLVGFGAANCFEGTAGTPVPSATLSVERKAISSSTSVTMSTGGADETHGNSEDSNNNAADFVTRAPQPQNATTGGTEILPLIPAFNDFYPKGEKITTTSFRAIANLNTQATVYVVIEPDGQPEPTPAQVVAGQDNTGTPVAANLKASVNVTAGSADFPFIMSGLTPASDYNVFFVASNSDGTMAAPFKVEITTLDPSDVTPPVFDPTYPRVVAVVDYAFTVVTKSSEPGNSYYVILPDNAPAPSAAQIKAGTDATGAAIGAGLFGTIESIAADVEYQTYVTVLTASTSYDVYFVAEDNIPNLQTAATKIDVTTTIPPFLDEFTGCVGVSTFTQFSVTGDQVWACTDFGRGSTGVRMNGFGSAAAVNEDWLISPLLSLQDHSNVSFFSQFSFAGNPLKLMISTNYSGSGNPTTATWTDLNASFPTVAVGSTSTSLADWSFTSVDLSAYPNQNVYVAFVYTSTAVAAARWTLDIFQVATATASYLTTSVASVKNFGYTAFPATSSSKSFKVKGQNLTADLIVTAPANFQVSKDGTAFSNSITFTAIEAASSPNVFVRFKPSAAGIGAVTGSISLASGPSARAVGVNGTEGIDPRSATFDITGYNLEFFGTNLADGASEYGPVDDDLQVANVTTVMETLASDIYGVVEVSEDSKFDQLVANLPGYNKVLSPRWSHSLDNPPDLTFPPQKIGFIYNTSTVEILSSRAMFSSFYDQILAGTVTLANYPGGSSSSFWSSGRLPFMIKARVTINAVSKVYTIIVIHGKSGSATEDYNRKQYDAKVLRDSLNANYATDNIILLGDFNDDVLGSISTGKDSSYKLIVDDVGNFNTLTLALTQTNASTFPSSSSFLDHIIISNELTESYVPNSIFIEDPNAYITNYASTTSDHLPLTARFVVKSSQAITFGPIADKTMGDATFAVSATASSLLPVSFTTTSDKITLAGPQVAIVKPGRVTITASQAGNDAFLAAPSVDQSFCIKPLKPIVTISNPNTETPVLTSNAATGNQWYLNGTLIAGATNATLNVTSPGIYKVQSKVDDCVSVFSSDIPIIVTGDLAKIQPVVAYPNPATRYIEVSGINQEINASYVVDMIGKVSDITFQKNDDVYRGDVEGLPSGVYLLRIQDGSSIHQVKFIKK